MNKLIYSFFLCCFTIGLFGQPLQTEIVSVNTQNFPFIFLNVVVEEEDSVVTNFNDGNFSICENGIGQTDFYEVIPPNTGMDSILPENRLVDIVFIFDNSGSLDDEQAAVANNFTNFIDDLKASGLNFSLGLVRYGQSAFGGQPILEENGNLTTDADFFLNEIYTRNVTDGGTEPGYQAILDAATGFNFRPGAQRVFVIITDETPGQGSITSQEATDLAVANSVTVFALTRMNLNTAFEQVTSETNGAIFDIFAPFDFIFDAISVTISNTYLIRYRSSQPQLDGVQRMLELKTIQTDTVDVDTAFYTPGAIPVVTLTQATNTLFENGQLPGEELLIQTIVMDAAAPFVQDVTLFYRNIGDATFNSANMSMVAGTDIWEGAIPAGFTEAPGVEFYVAATDGVSTVTSPSVNPTASPYQLAILPNFPPEIVHTPVTTTDVNFDLTIGATITDATIQVDAATLFYREFGNLVFTAVPMTAVGDDYSANIPASSLSCSGVEYYIRATDNFSVSSSSGTVDNPYFVSGSGVEICGDGLDNDCDGQIDESDPTDFYPDTDGDGFGDATATAVTLPACDNPPGFVANNTDCDDDEISTNPGAVEINGDGLDNDCDGIIDNCICPAVVAPVCANGITFNNACEAECAGYTNYTPGDCGTTGLDCTVIGDPGEICCDQTVCSDDPNPSKISSQRLPDNGTGDFEYVWIVTYIAPTPGNISNWTVVPNSNDAELDLDEIQQTAWVRRCARPLGCTDYAWESNIVKLTFDNCNGNGGSGAPDCANIGVVADANGVTVSGLDLAPISYVQVFDASWNTIFQCFDNCGVEQVLSLTPGTYHVLAKYFSATYQPLCEINEAVTVGGTTTPNNPNTNTPNTSGSPCDQVNIQMGINQLLIDGFDAGYRTHVQVFDNAWSMQFDCFESCGALVDLPLAAGSYNVLVKFFDQQYQLVCEVMQTVFITDNLLAFNDRFELKAVKSLEHVELNWLHKDVDENAREYLIQRAGEDQSFETLDRITARGGTAAELYQWFDIAPLPGANVYRIGVERDDQTIDFSENTHVYFPILSSLTIFPNPANLFTQINLEDYIGKQAVIYLNDQSGRQVQQYELDQIPGKYYQLDLRNLKEGVYMVWVHVDGFKPKAMPLMIGRH